MILKPRLDALGVEGVTAWQELTVLTELEVCNTDRAGGDFQRAIGILFAVLLLNFDNRQSIDD